MSSENMAENGPEEEKEAAGAGPGGTTFQWLEETLQDLVQTTTEVIRRGREAKTQLDTVTRELEPMRSQRQSLLSEVESLERRRRDLESDVEAERIAAAARIEQIRLSAESEVAQLRQSKERLEQEIGVLEERRAEVARQIESFLRDQLTVLRRMDAEAKAVAAVFRSASQYPSDVNQTPANVSEPRPPTEEVPPERRSPDAFATPGAARVTIVAKGFPDVATLIAFQKAVEQLSSVNRIETREFREGCLYLRVSARDRARVEAEISQLPGVPVSAVNAADDAVYVDLPPEP